MTYVLMMLRVLMVPVAVASLSMYPTISPTITGLAKQKYASYMKLKAVAAAIKGSKNL